jgi:hypothetical protein
MFSAYPILLPSAGGWNEAAPGPYSHIRSARRDHDPEVVGSNPTWEDYRVEAEEYRELDDERVLVFIRIGGRGKTSGLEVDQFGREAANLLHIRDGRVTRLVLYWNRERALADVGLAPETGSERS